MPFFQRKATKRNIQKDRKSFKKIKKKEEVKGKIDETNIESESDDDDVLNEAEVSSEDEDKYLTAQEKKVKLAKKYLEKVEKEELEKLENADEINDHVLKKLKNDELEKAGKLKKKVADHTKFDVDNQKLLCCKQHKLSITCLVVSSDSKSLYSASKDYAIVKWSLENFSKVNFLSLRFKKNDNNESIKSYHNCLINCLAISSDNKYLVSGNEKGCIDVWHPESFAHLHTFRAHKKSVTGLAICRETNFLYSTSQEVKSWNLNEMGYMETHFGHQAQVTSIDIINENRVLTAGGTDRTLRVWKIQEESQLIYNANCGSIEVVRKLDEGFFISGGDDGSLCLWGALKKKPLYVIPNAHGLDPTNHQPNWISALAVLPNSDLIASGSCDNFVRLWKWNQTSRAITPLTNISVTGFVNAIQFTSDSNYLIAGVGKEHRLGRWQCIKDAKNSLICVQIMKINGLS